MKRFLSLIIIGLLALAGCSDDDNNNNDKCTCTAQYTMCGGEVQTFPDTEIDCETGAVVGIPTFDPCASFTGCLD